MFYYMVRVNNGFEKTLYFQVKHKLLQILSDIQNILHICVKYSTVKIQSGTLRKLDTK
jgi:hypothetical protein